jgi:hypothetical protein
MFLDPFYTLPSLPMALIVCSVAIYFYFPFISSQCSSPTHLKSEYGDSICENIQGTMRRQHESLQSELMLAVAVPDFAIESKGFVAYNLNINP